MIRANIPQKIAEREMGEAREQAAALTGPLGCLGILSEITAGKSRGDCRPTPLQTWYHARARPFESWGGLKNRGGDHKSCVGASWVIILSLRIVRGAWFRLTWWVIGS